MLIRASLLIIAGGFAAQHSRVALSREQCCLIIVTALLLLLCNKRRSFVIYAASFAIGAALFMHTAVSIIEGRIDKKYVGDSMVSTVRIVDFPRQSGRSLVFTVSPLDDARLPKYSRISWFEPTVLPKIGEVWRLELRLRRPRGLSSPGAFDREAWLFREGFHATGYVVSGERNRKLAAGTVSMRDAIRRDYLRRLDARANDASAAAILAAIGVGLRHRLTTPQWQQFSVTGTSHLIAISGLHVGMAGSVGFLILAALSGVLRFTRNALVVATIGGVVCALCYAFIAGFGIPAMRASLMLLLVAAVFIARREPAFFKILVCAALLVFIALPTASMSPGFTLSFGAVLLLLWMPRRLPRRYRRWPKLQAVLSRLHYFVGVQAFLFFGLLPATVASFHRVPIVAPLANLVVVPVFSLIIVPIALLGLFVGQFSRFVTDVSISLNIVVIRSAQFFIQQLETLPFVNIETSGLYGAALLLPILILLCVVLPRGWPGRGLAIIATVAIVLHQPGRPPAGCARVNIVDVGQGSAHIVQTHSKTLLFDTGVAYRAGGSAAEQVVLPLLRDLGIRRLNWLVLSHGDNDHAGGVKPILDAYPVETLYVSGTTELAEFGAVACLSGKRWRQDGVDFHFLHPQSLAEASDNNTSCVLQVSAGAYSVLFSGDIEVHAEADLLSRGIDLRSKVVVIPHHGSNTSSTAGFIAATDASLAIASAGFANQWGFPKTPVVKRWRESGANVLTTGTSGTISFSLCKQTGLQEVREDRIARGQFWRE